MPCNIPTQTWCAQVFTKDIWFGELCGWVVALEDKLAIRERCCEEQALMHDTNNKVLDVMVDQPQIE